MSLNSTQSAERIHIGFFGKTNSGKSSLINAITNQKLSIVSEVKGTTTDPVYKSMELLPLGPVMLIDTAGYDDYSELGKLRIEKTKQVLLKTDIAILVIDSSIGLTSLDEEFLSLIKEKGIKYIIAYNKSDLVNETFTLKDNEIYVSAENDQNITELKDLIASQVIQEKKKLLLPEFIQENDSVILVTPIDSSAPKGRMILPQQQVIRELLDRNAVCITVQVEQLANVLKTITPKLVITDSQAFKKVNEIVPKDVLLTSFSILFANYKGVLEQAVKGVVKLNGLSDGDTILIAEGCTHHRQCEDIGTVKLPNWINKYTNKQINFEFSSGTYFPEDLSKYSMIIHCGSCMLKEQEVIARYKYAERQNIQISNYGITIAYLNGILKRTIEIFPDLYKML